MFYTHFSKLYRNASPKSEQQRWNIPSVAIFCMSFVFCVLTSSGLFVIQASAQAKSVEGTKIKSIKAYVCTGDVASRKKVKDGYISKVTGLGRTFLTTDSMVPGGSEVVLDCAPGMCRGTSVGAKNTELASNFKKDNDFGGDKLVNINGKLWCKVKGEGEKSTDEPKKPIDFAKDLEDMKKPEESLPKSPPINPPGSEDRKNFDQMYCNLFPKHGKCAMY
jgi:hypothetical protein